MVVDDEAEERQRRLDDAKQLVSAIESEMSRRCTGAVFGEFVDLVVAPEQDIEGEVRKVLDVVMPMSIKASDKVKKVLVHVLKWWAKTAAERLRGSELAVPQAQAENFVREVCTSKLLLPVLGQAIFPYFNRTQVDVSLVARVDKDPQARALCESIIGIGRALGLEVGAEGVETPAQLATLLGLGCGFAQGFLIARPTSLAPGSSCRPPASLSRWDPSAPVRSSGAIAGSPPIICDHRRASTATNVSRPGVRTASSLVPDTTGISRSSSTPTRVTRPTSGRSHPPPTAMRAAIS